MTADGLYVYAVVRSGQPLPKGAAGVDDPPARVRSVRQGEVAAVVSAVPAVLRARRRDLLAHQALLMLLAERGPVLPMRFGTVAPDERTLRDQLSQREARHLLTLERVADCVEVNVKIFPAQDALARLVEDDPKVRRLRDAARRRPGYEASLRLGQSIALALDDRAREAGRRAVRALGPLAREAAAGPEVQGCVLNTSFLVGRDDSDAFRAEADRLASADRERMQARVSEPLPCYSFVGPQDAPARTAGVGG
ncbi:GvpL/GvpF family gas vesicle protein [Streptomyces sp. NPDC048566]|uniref:GvpL/GvpF family gas vesicle protein n=1 Tax=Streptomyces sp. NPDC048566 TaxID=3365569 RepID=UPI00371641EA